MEWNEIVESGRWRLRICLLCGSIDRSIMRLVSSKASIAYLWPFLVLELLFSLLCIRYWLPLCLSALIDLTDTSYLALFFIYASFLRAYCITYISSLFRFLLL